jgi:aquaporin Z
LGQLWLFWVAPIIGAVLAGATYKAVFEAPEKA